MSTSTTRNRRHGWPAALLIFIPLAAHADALIPYLIVPWGQAVLLPLVIVIEASILKRLLGGPFRSNLFQSFVANLTSTALGVGLYFITMPAIGGGLFHWWFMGGFSIEAVRSACIALLFATVLWTVSWVSETAVIVRMRKASAADNISASSATANLITYGLLLALAVWFGRDSSEADAKANIDTNRNSHTIKAFLKHTPEYPLVGFWKGACTDDFGSAIEAAVGGKYTVAFCGPGGCDRVERLTPISLENDPSYRVIDQNTIEERWSGGTKLHRCEGNE